MIVLIVLKMTARSVMDFRQKDRGTKEYDAPCKDCLVLDHIVCPVADEAYERGITLRKCEFAKAFGEQIVKALTAKYGNPQNKRSAQIM